MSSLIRFEIKKFFHRKKNILAIALFLMLSIVYVLLNINLEGKVNESQKNLINSDIESIEVAIKGVDLEQVNQSDNEKLREIRNGYEKDLNLLKEKREGFNLEDTKKYLISSIEYDKKLVKEVESGEIIYGGDLEELKNNIKINEILLDKNIKPINGSSAMEGFNFIRLFLNNPISILIAILIILLSGDIVSSEYDNNTYKLLFTQPVSKNKIVVSKIISTLLLVLTIVFGIIGVIFITLGVTRGFGTINYPVEFYGESLEFISIGDLIVYELLLLIMIIVFLTLIAILISTLTKNTTSSISLSIILVVATYMMSSKGLIKAVSHLNPFIYLDISDVIQGRLAINLGNTNINLETGMILFMVINITLLILIPIVFSKKTSRI
ncbi:MAG: ABC transporter permease subunit [Clostridium sp.]